MSSRIYYVRSAWDWAEEPTNVIGYIDPDGTAKEVPTNIEYDLGTGHFALREDGSLLVYGLRAWHYTGDIEYFVDWWDGANYDQETLTEDVLLYTLDAELANPQVINTGLVNPDYGWQYGEGWAPTEFTSPNNVEGANNPIVTPDGPVIFGSYFVEGSVQIAQLYNLFDEDGQLQKRDAWWYYPNSYYTPEGDLLGKWGHNNCWATYDPKNRIIYWLAGWTSITRYFVDTGVMEHADQVFVRTPQATEYSGEPWEGRANASHIVFDPTTGWIWSLAYCAYASEGYNNGRMRLVAFDPELFVWDTDMWHKIYRDRYPRDYTSSQDPAVVADYLLQSGQNDPTLGSAYFSCALTLDPDAGVAYFVKSINHSYEVTESTGETYTDTSRVPAIFKVTLATGEIEEVQRILIKIPADPQYYDPNYFWYSDKEVFQLAIAPPKRLKGRFLESRRGFKGRLSS